MELLRIFGIINVLYFEVIIGDGLLINFCIVGNFCCYGCKCYDMREWVVCWISFCGYDEKVNWNDGVFRWWFLYEFGVGYGSFELLWMYCFLVNGC